jgi:hypothetical protein
MQVQVNIRDRLWQESLKLGIKEKDIDKIAEDALKKHVRQLKSYQKLLKLEGKVQWEGNINEMRINGIL